MARMGGLLGAALLLAAIGALGVMAWSGTGDQVTIATAEGETLGFDPPNSRVRGAGPFLITFRNVSALPHNLVFVGEADGRSQAIVQPGTEATVTVSAPRPGTYEFVCTIHEGMRGTLLVE